VIEGLTRDSEIADDIAVLAVHSVAFEPTLDVQVRAEAEQLASLRHLVRRWVAAHEGTDDDCAAFAIAVSEACANAITHAYGPGDATIYLQAELIDVAPTGSGCDAG